MINHHFDNILVHSWLVTAGLIVNAYMEDLAEDVIGQGRKEIFNSKVGHTVKVGRRQNFEN